MLAAMSIIGGGHSCLFKDLQDSVLGGVSSPSLLAPSQSPSQGPTHPLPLQRQCSSLPGHFLGDLMHCLALFTFISQHPEAQISWGQF